MMEPPANIAVLLVVKVAAFSCVGEVAAARTPPELTVIRSSWPLPETRPPELTVTALAMEALTNNCPLLLTTTEPVAAPSAVLTVEGKAPVTWSVPALTVTPPEYVPEPDRIWVFPPVFTRAMVPAPSEMVPEKDLPGLTEPPSVRTEAEDALLLTILRYLVAETLAPSAI